MILPSAEDVIAALELSPHPEGGFYRETFRAAMQVTSALTRADRAASTAIYFLLREGDLSALHRVRSDEAWHHYLGAPLELHTISPTGVHERVMLGKDLARGERPQYVVPADTWQAARIVGEGYGLFGCTVAPGFDFEDFSLPTRDELVDLFPELSNTIEALTR